MRNKKIIILSVIITVLILGTVISSFAYGPRFKIEGEKITLKGKVTLENRRFPELNVNGKVYKLMVPFYAVNDLQIKDNDNVEVEAYKTKDAFSNDPANKDQDIMAVTKISFNGKSVDLQKDLLENGGCGCGGDRGKMPFDRGGPGQKRGMWY